MTKVFPSGKQLITSPMLFKQLCQFSKPILGPNAIDSPIWRQAPQPGLADPNYLFSWFEDFIQFTTTQAGLTGPVGTGGSAAAGDAAAGQLVLTGSGTDNQAALLISTNELFSVDADTKLFFEARVKISEINATVETGAFCGFTEGTPADAVPLTDDGAGIADDDHIGIAKLDGASVWSCKTGDGAAGFTTSDGPTRTANTWTRLGFIADPTQVDFFVDSQLIATHTTNLPTAGELMHLVIGVKCGSADAETCTIDWFKVAKIRA